jgi:hypothetical protein
MKTPRFGRWPKVVALGAAMLLSISVAYAAGAEGSPDLAGVTRASGRSITQVKLVRSTNLNFTSSQTFVAVPGASATVKVPAASKGVLVARFSAVSNCTEPSNVIGSYGCELRVLVNGVEAAPASGQSEVFDSSGADGREAHAIERSRGPVGPGTYVVTVQYAVPAATVSFDLVGWTLEVDLVKV